MYPLKRRCIRSLFWSPILPASIEARGLRHALVHEAQSLWRNASGPEYTMCSIIPRE